ncbi:MAG: protein-methionine-sulfoxide reductase catalytic subunit MsrP [Planctomycetes bacterium]|nr:protein-methionine-sulfoxide reductase catalytic subunit MsrP [Planctomycetota bacterium]
MNFISRKPWDPSLHKLTEESVYRNRTQHRRDFLASLGHGSIGLMASSLLIGCNEHKPDQKKLKAAADIQIPKASKAAYPAERNQAFTYGRDETVQEQAAIYTNFYEFSTSKQTYLYVDGFTPTPWEVKVDGLCDKPMTFDLDDLHSRFPLEERAYRHRCVETWAMCVPWTGFPLQALLKQVEPEPGAKYVQFETFNRPTEAQNIADSSFPWPYTEGLTIEEAMNDLTFLTTGIYGEPLPRQHGAPIRIVLPWKYGFKSIKSIVRITLTAKKPDTFWNVVNPREYGFEANVDPGVPHPRWSQSEEWMLGTRERFPTVKYNGYGDYVAKLYG